jgi:hypothetical protein
LAASRHPSRLKSISLAVSHLVASGWIAIPDEISMDEAEAAKLFYAAGAWHQVKVAA